MKEYKNDNTKTKQKTKTTTKKTTQKNIIQIGYKFLIIHREY